VPEWLDSKSYETIEQQRHNYNLQRERKWDVKFGEGTTKKLTKGRQMKRWFRKGVPLKYRKRGWMTISGAKILMDNNEGLYQRLVEEGKNQVTKHTLAIDKDLHRTFPENAEFTIDEKVLEYKQYHPNEPLNEEDLPLIVAQMRRILGALAVYVPTVGYCQGLNYLCGMILLILREEESSFWLLYTIIKHLTPTYHTEGFAAMTRDQAILNDLLKIKDATLYEHFVKQGVSVELISINWFITLFIDQLPLETALRIWDSVIYEGEKILFRVMLALFKKHRTELLAAKGAMLFLVCKHMAEKELDPTALLTLGFGIKLKRSQLRNLRSKHTSKN